MTRQQSKSQPQTHPDLQFENQLWNSGVKFIAGVDEAGRGAWAGPVTAGAVILPFNKPGLLDELHGVRDSKMMSARQRDYWAARIQNVAVAFSSGWATCEEIDLLGILPSTRLAMSRALDGLGLIVEHLMIDAVRLAEVDIPQTSLIKGDARVLSIAAASIIAKTARDKRMQLMEEEIAGYGFDRHKGYGTALHRDALSRLGVSVQHRRSYAPIKALLDNTAES